MNTAEKQAHYANKIAEIESLPPFPLLANIIKAFLAAENNGEIRPLIDNIETEPNIVAKVIGVANSAAFGSQQPVRSIKDAIIKLGIIQLKSLVFGLILGARFDSRKCPSFDTGRFWRDSMLLAYCATLMVDHCHNMQFNRNEVYSVALVLRIGMLALVNIAPLEMNELLSRDDVGDLLMKERSVFNGIDHFDAGAVLLNHWQLPQMYGSVTAHIKDRFHDGDNLNLIYLLQRAKQLLVSEFMHEDTLLDQKLGLSTQDIELVADTFQNEKSWILSFAEHL